MEKHSVSALVLAAGIGSRMRSDTTKQLMMLDGKSVIARSVELYENASSVDEIIVVVKEDEVDTVKELIKGFSKVKKIIIGGKVRAESAKNGFEAISSNADFVAIHDAARCMTTTSDIEKVISDAVKYGAATASTRVTDTLKEIDDNGFVKFTHDRSSMRFVQTPQVFSCELYKKALAAIDVFYSRITDDNFMLENIGARIYCTETSVYNIKLTTPEDIEYAKFLLRGNKIIE